MSKESLWPAAAGIAIAGISLALSIQQMYTDREFRKLSVRPELFIKFDWAGHYENDKTVEVRLTMFNRGLGPAKIRRWAVCLDGDSMGSISQLAATIGDRLLETLDCKSVPSYQSFRFNPVLNNGETLQVLNINNICRQKIETYPACNPSLTDPGCVAFRSDIVDQIKTSVIDKIEIRLHYESMFGEIERTRFIPSSGQVLPDSGELDGDLACRSGV